MSNLADGRSNKQTNGDTDIINNTRAFQFVVRVL